MNYLNLTRELTFKDGRRLYTPPDPYRIYERLAKIYLMAKDAEYKLKTSRTIEKPYGVLDDYRSYFWRAEVVNERIQPLHFVKWVRQEIPKEFWKFNTYIDINEDKLIKSAIESNVDEIWTDVPGRENKIKVVFLNSRVTGDVKSGKLLLPTYEDVSKEVPTWGDYKYKYGRVPEPSAKWR